ncbi:MAG TPA: hypothetical protein VGD14_01620 [bacterium]
MIRIAIVLSMFLTGLLTPAVSRASDKTVETSHLILSDATGNLTNEQLKILADDAQETLNRIIAATKADPHKLDSPVADYLGWEDLSAFRNLQRENAKKLGAHNEPGHAHGLTVKRQYYHQATKREKRGTGATGRFNCSSLFQERDDR